MTCRRNWTFSTFSFSVVLLTSHESQQCALSDPYWLVKAQVFRVPHLTFVTQAFFYRFVAFKPKMLKLFPIHRGHYKTVFTGCAVNPTFNRIRSEMLLSIILLYSCFKHLTVSYLFHLLLSLFCFQFLSIWLVLLWHFHYLMFFCVCALHIISLSDFYDYTN